MAEARIFAGQWSEAHHRLRLSAGSTACVVPQFSETIVTIPFHTFRMYNGIVYGGFAAAEIASTPHHFHVVDACQHCAHFARWIAIRQNDTKTSAANKSVGRACNECVRRCVCGMRG